MVICPLWKQLPSHPREYEDEGTRARRGRERWSGQGAHRSLQPRDPSRTSVHTELPGLASKQEHLLNATATSCFLPLPAPSCPESGSEHSPKGKHCSWCPPWSSSGCLWSSTDSPGLQENMLGEFSALAERVGGC